MAFLDNSGDIILDAVLTDTGRMRLAKGDGTFKIVKFSLADDEIDYELFNKSHPSGSAYYDLEIMQTPVLEAFTNNTSTMKHKLISIPRTNLLYLPTIKLNESTDLASQRVVAPLPAPTGVFLVAVDETTLDEITTLGQICPATGVLDGEDANSGNYIRVDQGIDSSEISPALPLDSDLIETQYIIQIDDRFGKIVSEADGAKEATVSFKDDDNIASYYLSLNTDTEFVFNNSEKLAKPNTQTISGPRGTYLQFKIQSSLDLNTSTFLFQELGGGATMTLGTGDGERSYYYIDSNVRVTGATTGRSIDIPVRFTKFYT
jgi:hypothetical protein